MTVRTEAFGRFSGRLPDADRFLASAALAAIVAEPLVGTLAALAFLAAGMAMMALRPAASLVDLADYRLLLLLPAFCLASTIWSEVPGLTLRAAIQLAATFIVAILLARRLPPGRFLAVLGCVLGVIVALSVTTGNYRADTGALTGYYASKNAMAAAAALLAVVAAGFAGRAGASMAFRAGALGLAVAGAGTVVLAQSMGALFAMFIGLGAYPALWALRRVGLRLQVAASVFLALALAYVSVVLAANIDAVSAFVLDLTGKDITLTGRTDLWRVAMEEIAERPLLGSGFQAFWHQGNPVAIQLWAMFGIESRSGFHFHNTYLSNAVEIGILGVAIQSAILLSIGLSTLRLALSTREHLSAILFACAVMILSVTPLEVPVFFQFNLHTLLMVAALVYARDGLRAGRR
jgi:exopolysaccharide production protein ExoQ